MFMRLDIGIWDQRLQINLNHGVWVFVFNILVKEFEIALYIWHLSGAPDNICSAENQSFSQSEEALWLLAQF